MDDQRGRRERAEGERGGERDRDRRRGSRARGSSRDFDPGVRLHSMTNTRQSPSGADRSGRVLRPGCGGEGRGRERLRVPAEGRDAEAALLLTRRSCMHLPRVRVGESACRMHHV
ncbi:MAG: hypothetical protein JNL83_04390 [Myxococcales bacterium]|nr:hypothetical protein [Myxococcales bacterium]